MEVKIEQVINLLRKCSKEQKQAIFSELRKEISIHPIEEKLNVQAEIILEAINKDDQGLTLRMMRGVIAEAAFDIEVVSKLEGWSNETPYGDLPFDFLLSDSIGSVKVQVKLQRSKDLKPMLAKEGYRRFSENLFIVETQKTRGGKDAAGRDTRPYSFDEFDIIAVCMQPSCGNWSTFYYSLSRWLIPREDDASKMLKFQPVAMNPNEFWTDDFKVAVNWFRSNVQKVIPY